MENADYYRNRYTVDECIKIMMMLLMSMPNKRTRPDDTLLDKKNTYRMIERERASEMFEKKENNK